MNRIALLVALSFAGGGLARAADGVQPAGPFVQGNKAIGTWKVVSKGKASPFSEERTTSETVLTTKAVVNGWFLETSDEGRDPTKSLTTVGADGVLRLWLFTTNNAVTMTGKLSDDGTTTTFTGTDLYGSAVELTDKWLDDDHREGHFLLKSKDATLVDLKMTTDRVEK